MLEDKGRKRHTPLHVVLHIIFKTHLFVINQSGGEKQVHNAQIMAIFRWKSWPITLSTRQTPVVSRRSPINNTTFYTPRRATATHLLRPACANLLCVCMCACCQELVNVPAGCCLSTTFPSVHGCMQIRPSAEQETLDCRKMTN